MEKKLDFENNDIIIDEGDLEKVKVIEQNKLKNRIEEFKDNIDKKVLEFTGLNGYILYFVNDKTMNSKIEYIPKLTPTLQIKSTKELVYLDKPAFQMNGKPVFVLVRHYPISIDLEFLNHRLVEIGFTADEIDAKVNSIFVNHVWRRSLKDGATIAIFILGVLFAFMSGIFVGVFGGA